MSAAVLHADLVAPFMFVDKAEMARVLTEELPAIDGVARLESDLDIESLLFRPPVYNIMLHEESPPAEIGPHDAIEFPAPVVKLDDLDMTIIDLLRVASTTETPGSPACPNDHGGVCLGSIDAGTYTTSDFNPPITYTVPDGWANLEDLTGNFLLQKTNDSRYLGIFQNVRAPAECDEAWAEGVGGTVEDLVGWYTTHPGLMVTEPEEVTIGSLAGVFIDLSLDPSWDITCPYSDGQPVVPFIIGNGTSQLHHVILPGFQERLYLLEWDGGNVAIEVASEVNGSTTT